MAKRTNQEPLKPDTKFDDALRRFAQVNPNEIQTGPVSLVEYEGSADRFLIFGDEDGPSVQVRFDNGTPWFTYGQMANVFGVDQNTVIDHVQNFLELEN